jgi:transglutaminase-like putative cysteine protease
VYFRIEHRVEYRYDRPVTLSPQQVRLFPRAHFADIVRHAALHVDPHPDEQHWRLDRHGNRTAQLRFAAPLQAWSLRVELHVAPHEQRVARTASAVSPSASQRRRHCPAVTPACLEKSPAGPRLGALLHGLAPVAAPSPEWAAGLAAQLNAMVAHQVRHEPGIQPPETTLRLGRGSCRDSAWLLVQVLRHLGLPARLVSGYWVPQLLQHDADEEHRRVPGEVADHAGGLHAWAEVCLPQHGWLGLDALHGPIVTAAHLPLACAPQPEGIRAVTGRLQRCAVEMHESFVVRQRATPQASALPGGGLGSAYSTTGAIRGGWR